MRGTEEPPDEVDRVGYGNFSIEVSKYEIPTEKADQS